MIDRSYITFIGRLLLGLIFVMSAFQKVADPGGTLVYMEAMGLSSATTALYLGAIAVELVGGVSLVLGLWSRIGAVILVLFMIPATLIFHVNFGDSDQTIHFMKNLSIIGGLIYVYVYGPGRFSIDAGVEETVEETDQETVKRVVNQ